jgi:hypothetical protein
MRRRNRLNLNLEQQHDKSSSYFYEIPTAANFTPSAATYTVTSSQTHIRRRKQWNKLTQHDPANYRTGGLFQLAAAYIVLSSNVAFVYWFT